MHYCYVVVDRDPVAQKQEDAGSLANFCPSLESGFDIEEQKNRKRDIRGIIIIIGRGIQLLSDRCAIFLCTFAKTAATKSRIFILHNVIYF